MSRSCARWPWLKGPLLLTCTPNLVPFRAPARGTTAAMVQPTKAHYFWARRLLYETMTLSAKIVTRNVLAGVGARVLTASELINQALITKRSPVLAESISNKMELAALIVQSGASAGKIVMPTQLFRTIFATSSPASAYASSAATSAPLKSRAARQTRKSNEENVMLRSFCRPSYPHTSATRVY